MNLPDKYCFKTFESNESKINTKNSNIIEVVGNLFDVPSNYSLAHCVSEDLKMGAGIALEFKKRFKGYNELIMQNPKVRNVIFLKKSNRYILYLITKKRYFHKPTYEDLFYTLVNLRNFCDKHNITILAIPKIACGLDKLNWKRVLYMINWVFEGSNTLIRIHSI